MRRLFSAPSSWQIFLCLLGVVASLVPTLPRTGAVWGFTRSWASLDPDRVRIDTLSDGTPAAKAGLQSGDYVTAVGDQTVDGPGRFDNALKRIRPGTEVPVRVSRGREELTVTLVGEAPRVEAIVYYDWQFISGGALLVLALLLIATQPLRPAPLWRAALVSLVGLALLAALVMIDWSWQITPVRRYWAIDNLPYPWVQQTFCAAIAGGLVILGVLEARRLLSQGQRSI